MGPGRQIETRNQFFEKMPENVRNGIEAIAIDMWEAYIHSARKWCPNADIVFDLLHVVKSFNGVIDEIRNQEFKNTDAQGRSAAGGLKGGKYLFLKTWRNLQRAEKIRLNDIRRLNELLNTVYWLKDFLKHIWSYRRPGWAEAAITEWCNVASEDGHPALKRFANMLETRSYGIVNSAFGGQTPDPHQQARRRQLQDQGRQAHRLRLPRPRLLRPQGQASATRTDFRQLNWRRTKKFNCRPVGCSPSSWRLQAWGSR